MANLALFLAGINFAELQNLARAQEKYYDSYPPTIQIISRAYESGFLFWFCFIGLLFGIMLAISQIFRMKP